MYDDGHGYCFSCNHFEPVKGKRDSEYTYEYLPWRGVVRETMQFYGVKTKCDSGGLPLSLDYPYANGSSKIRLRETKDFYSTGEISKAGLFGRDRFDPLAHKSVTITEGELDALSAYQMLQTPCVSISSSSNGLRDCTLEFSWLREYEKIYLCLDNDKPGRLTAAAIAKLFEYGRVLDVRLNKYKDANEYLQNGEEAEFRNIWYTAKPYIPDTIKSSLSDFQAILEETPKQGIPYGPFSKLTELTYGLRRGEVTLLTAREGVGKTEFLHAIEYSILTGGEDHKVGGFFLEEQPIRHLQSLAGIHLHRPVHLPDSGVGIGETQTAIREVLKSDSTLFLDTQFGNVDIEHLLGTARYLVAGAGCSVLILDHASVACGGGDGDQERKQLDTLFTRAETMAKELDCAWLIVQHVNDFGQTRGSRWGSKMADTRIDLHRDVDSGSNVLSIYVSKNRFAGRTGHAGDYEFNPITRQYTLMTGANNVQEDPKAEAA